MLPCLSLRPWLGRLIIFAGLLSAQSAATEVSVVGSRWFINGKVTNPGSEAEGLLMNVRMVNATFEDRNQPDFDPEANTDKFLAQLADYAAHGANAFTFCLQGGNPEYEGAVNSAFNPDGSLRPDYLRRVERVLRACDRQGVAVILTYYYQRQSKILRDEAAVRAGVEHATRWVLSLGLGHVLIEVANEFGHGGFASHPSIRSPEGQACAAAANGNGPGYPRVPAATRPTRFGMARSISWSSDPDGCASRWRTAARISPSTKR